MPKPNITKEKKAIEKFNGDFSIGERVMYHPTRNADGIEGIIKSKASLFHVVGVVWVDPVNAGCGRIGNVSIHHIMKTDSKGR